MTRPRIPLGFRVWCTATVKMNSDTRVRAILTGGKKNLINTAVVFFVFGKMEITKSFRRTLPHASAREGFASAGLNFHIASADPFRNGCFAEFAGLASQVRAGVLRRLFVWANLAGSFNHQQTVQAYMKHAKTEANLKKLIGGYRLRLLNSCGVGNFSAGVQSIIGFKTFGVGREFQWLSVFNPKSGLSSWGY